MVWIARMSKPGSMVWPRVPACLAISARRSCGTSGYWSHRQGLEDLCIFHTFVEIHSGLGPSPASGARAEFFKLRRPFDSFYFRIFRGLSWVCKAFVSTNIGCTSKGRYWSLCNSFFFRDSFSCFRWCVRMIWVAGMAKLPLVIWILSVAVCTKFA